VLSAVAFAGGGVLGLIAAILRTAPVAPLRWVASAYVQLIQGTPLLLQLFVLYFGANLVGIRVDAWSAAALGLSLYTGAFLGEIWRGAIEAVPVSQWEAARSLGLGYGLQLLLIVIPQTVRFRDSAHHRLPGPGYQEHLTRLDHWLRGVDPDRPAGQQRHLSAIACIRDCGDDVFRAVLALSIAAQRLNGALICRSAGPSRPGLAPTQRFRSPSRARPGSIMTIVYRTLATGTENGRAPLVFVEDHSRLEAARFRSEPGDNVEDVPVLSAAGLHSDRAGGKTGAGWLASGERWDSRDGPVTPVKRVRDQ